MKKTILQNIITSREVSRFPLYFKVIAGETFSHVILQDDNTLLFNKNDTISFDTYFNALFEHYLISHTVIKNVTLHLELSGSGVLEVFRYTKGKAAETLLIQSFDTKGEKSTIELPVPLEGFHSMGSRIAFTLTGKDANTQFISGHWYTTDSPLREVVINPVICTFKKVPYVRRAVSRLLGYAPLNDINWELTIVDNASELTTEEFSSPRIQVIRQSNVGGAGGFTRGAIEALRQKNECERKPTHVLFMDDDMDMEPECLLRTVRMIGFMSKISCIGGAMLDLYRPTDLFEQGALLDSSNDFFALCAKFSGLPLGECWALDAISAAQTPLTYNAWWFFAFPVVALEKIGLPMPCFIRGDDQEFGMRLAQAGYETMTPPSIGIWHEPFYAKPATWMQYFGLYNNLLIVCLRRNEIDLNAISKRVKSIILNALAKKDYESAMVHLGALQDFLNGPAYFMSTAPAERLKRARSFSEKFGPELQPIGRKLGASKLKPIKSLASRDMWRIFGHGHRALSVLKKIGAVKESVFLHEHEWNWHLAAQNETIEVSHTWLPYIRVYKTKPELYFSIKKETEQACRQIKVELPRLKSEFNEAAGEFTSLPFWKKYLNLI